LKLMLKQDLFGKFLFYISIIFNYPVLQAKCLKVAKIQSISSLSSYGH
jgi:hypothetical protein